MSDFVYIVPNGELISGSEGVSDFEDKLKSLNKPAGWDYGQGEEITNEVINHACVVFNYIEKPNIKYSVVPNTQGGIKITSKIGSDNFLDIRINPDLTLDLIHEVGIGVDYEILCEEDGVSIAFIENYLNYLLSKLCFLSEPYIATSSIPTKEDLTATSLRTIEAASQSSVWIAQYGTAEI